MKFTSFLGLKKPEQNDYYNVSDQGINADLIDGKLKTHEERLAHVEGDIDTLSGEATDLRGELEGMKQGNADYSDPVSVLSHPYFVNNKYAGQLRTLLKGRQFLNLMNIVKVTVDSGSTINGNRIKMVQNNFLEYCNIYIPSKIDDVVSLVIKVHESTLSSGNLQMIKPTVYNLEGDVNSDGLYYRTTVSTSDTDRITLSLGGSPNGEYLDFEIYAIANKDISSYGIDRVMNTGWNFANPVFTEKVVGKNLFDGEMEIGSLNSSTGQPDGNSTAVRSVNFTDVVEGETYRFSQDGVYKTTNVYYYDSDENYIRSETLSTFTVPPGASKVKFYYGTGYEKTEKLQLEYGTTPTAYEPYKEQLRKIDVSNRCPAGLTKYDYIDANGVFHMLWSGEWNTLDGTESWEVPGALNQNDTKVFELKSDQFKAQSNTVLSILSANFPVSTSVAVWNFDKEGLSLSDNGYIRLRILRSKITSNINTWLAENNIKFRAELLTPAEVDLQHLKLMCDTSCIYSIDSEGLPPEVELVYPENQAASDRDVHLAVENLNKQSGAISERLEENRVTLSKEAAVLRGDVDNMKQENALYSDSVSVPSHPYYVNNKYAGRLRTLLKGRQVYNLLDSGIGNSLWSIQGTGASITPDGLVFGTNTGTNIFGTVPLENIKPNTIHTIVYEVFRNTSDLDNVVVYGVNTPFNDFTLNKNVGIHYAVKTSNADISDDRFFIDPNIITSGEFGIRLLGIVEGDISSQIIDKPMTYGWNFAVPVFNEKAVGKNIAKKVEYMETAQYGDSVLVDAPLQPDTEYTFSLIIPSGERYYANENLFVIASSTAVGDGTRKRITLTTKPIISVDNIDQYNVNKGWRVFKNSTGYLSSGNADLLQVENGNPAEIKYEAYDEHLRKIDVTDVCPAGPTNEDYIDVNGVFHMNFDGDWKVLDGSRAWNPSGIPNQVDTIVFGFSNTNYAEIPGNVGIVSDVFESFSTGGDDGLWSRDIEGISVGSDGVFRLRILRSKLATEDVAGLKTWLATNNVKFRARLKTPTEVDLQLPDLMCDANSTYSINSEGLPPEVQLIYPENQGASDRDIHLAVGNLNKRSDAFSEQLDKIPNEYSVIDHNHEGVYETVINKKSGFNLDKTDVTSSSSSILLATAKAVKSAFDKAVEALNVANTKASASHNHSGVYEPVITKATGFNLNKSDTVSSTSTTTLATSKAVKDAYDRGTTALNTANTKASASHNHAGVYEPVFSKASGFNLAKSDSVTSTSTATLATSKAVKDAYDRGTTALSTANTKASASHNHAGVYEPVFSKASGFNLAKSDSVTSTSTTTLATCKAVKTAYDRGSAGVNAANAITNVISVSGSGAVLNSGRFTVDGVKQPKIIISTASANVAQMSDGDIWIQYQA